MQESVARAGWAGDLTPALLRKANSQNRRAAISRFFEKRKVEKSFSKFECHVFFDGTI
tara:strand:+ start:336 stop:509 length:174 start_codon:yes stop_codon:yes gene_type:complete